MRWVLPLVGLLAAAPLPLLAQGQTNCPDDCVWVEGYGFKCVDGTAGCKCRQQGASCSFYNCDGPVCGPPPDEEDEDAVAATGGVPVLRGVHLVDVGSDYYAVWDRCPAGPLMMLRIGSHTSLEIVQRMGASTNDH